MKPLTLILMVILSPFLVADDAVEPPIIYTLQVGDEKIRTTANNEVKLQGVFENPTMKIVPDEQRLFNYAGISFQYPKYFSFEADFTEEGVKIWSLDGNDNVIMVQHFPDQEISLNELVQSTLDIVGRQTKTQKVNYTFNNHKLEGTRLLINIAGITIYQDVCKLPSKGGARFLIIQDMPASEKVSDKEVKQLKKLLSDSLKIST